MKASNEDIERMIEQLELVPLLMRTIQFQSIIELTLLIMLGICLYIWFKKLNRPSECIIWQLCCITYIILFLGTLSTLLLNIFFPEIQAILKLKNL